MSISILEKELNAIRKEYGEECAVIPNHVLFDKNINSRQRSILIYYFSYYPEKGWRATVNELVEYFKLSPKTITRHVKVLVEKGYLIKKRIRKKELKFEHLKIKSNENIKNHYKITIYELNLNYNYNNKGMSREI